MEERERIPLETLFDTARAELVEEQRQLVEHLYVLLHRLKGGRDGVEGLVGCRGCGGTSCACPAPSAPPCL